MICFFLYISLYQGQDQYQPFPGHSGQFQGQGQGQGQGGRGGSGRGSRGGQGQGRGSRRGRGRGRGSLPSVPTSSRGLSPPLHSNSQQVHTNSKIEISRQNVFTEMMYVLVGFQMKFGKSNFVKANRNYIYLSYFILLWCEITFF